MADKREEDACAKHRERLFAAFDEGLPDFPLQVGPVLRHQTRHDECQHDEMQKPIGGEICLVAGVERVEQPVREHFSELRETPRHRHHQRKRQVGNPEIKQGRHLENRAAFLQSAEREPGAQHEQQLPAERVERPVAIGKGRQVPFQRARSKIECNRCGQRQVRLVQHDPQHRREQRHQNDKELQDVEVERLGFQQQPMRQ